MELVSIAVFSCSCCWVRLGCAATTVMTPKWRGVTNQQIAREFHGTGGDHAPLRPVVTLPAGRSVDSAGVRGELRALEARFEQVLPGSRQAGYASTGSRAFVSADGRTTFIIA